MYITPTDLLKRYAAGERNFAGITTNGVETRSFLCGADLSNIILSGAYLSRIRLEEVDFSGAKLVGTYLGGATLNRSDFSKADLTGAYLRRAVLASVNLRSANLTGANLSGATLSGADLTYARLQETNLSQVDLSRIKFYYGVSRTLTSLIANDALLWETTLPDGQFEPGPRYYSCKY